MRVLGIDPGIALVGWGIVEKTSDKTGAVDYGCIQTLKTDTLAKRLEVIFDKTLKLIQDFKPKAMAVENIYFAANAKTALIVGQARGVVLLAAQKGKLPVFEYTPLQIKIALTGYGRADKNQIQQMVKVLLSLDQIPKPDDTADALAVALCYLQSERLESLTKREV